jgi:hypothetical protein
MMLGLSTAAVAQLLASGHIGMLGRHTRNGWHTFLEEEINMLKLSHPVRWG